MYKIAITIIILVSISIPNYNNVKINAHNFNTDDNSSFLTLINNLIIQKRLLDDSITIDSKDNTSIEYLKNIDKISDNMLYASFNIDTDQFYNNTVIAITIANLSDEVLQNYGRVYGIPKYVMLSMNYSKADSMQNNSSLANIIPNNYTNISKDEKITSIPIDIVGYDIAIETANRILEIYDSRLNKSSAKSEYTNSVIVNIGNTLLELKQNLENKEKPSLIMQIVHERIHPNLQAAFNLSIGSSS